MTRPSPMPALFLALVAGFLAPSGQARADEPRKASLTLTFTGLKSSRGSIEAVLAGSPEAYADKAEPSAGVSVAATAGTVSATINNLQPGRYALKAFHDLDGDGQLDFGALGIPREPFAFSNNARPVMGPPPWRAAVFEVKPGRNIQTIRIE